MVGSVVVQGSGPVPEPSPEPIVELEIPAPFVDTSKDPQYYIDRYNNESTYKEWFDDNYPKYDSIYQAVGLSEYNLEKYYELIAISTKKTQYTTGDTIVITGKVSTSDFDMPVTLQVFNGGNLVEIAQITISSNQNFSHTLLAEGKLWSNSGTYTVKATFGSDTKDTSFIFRPISSPSDEFDDPVTIEPAPTSQTIVDLDISVNDSIFDLGDLVSISIKADDFSGTKSVSVDVTDPRGNSVISRSVTLSPNDSQSIDFRLSENSKSGNYKVTATTYDNGKIITEKTNFKVQSQFNSFNISGVTVSDQQGNPSSLDAGEMGFIKVNLKSNKLISTLVTVNLFDSELTSIGIGSVKTSLASGDSEIILSFMIPDDAAIGPADIYVNAFSDWPSKGGIALTGELSGRENIGMDTIEISTQTPIFTTVDDLSLENLRWKAGFTINPTSAFVQNSGTSLLASYSTTNDSMSIAVESVIENKVIEDRKKFAEKIENFKDTKCKESIDLEKNGTTCTYEVLGSYKKIVNELPTLVIIDEFTFVESMTSDYVDSRLTCMNYFVQDELNLWYLFGCTSLTGEEENHALIELGKSFAFKEITTSLDSFKPIPFEERSVASFVDPIKDPIHYIDRYHNEPSYKEWFDENYSQYSSIYDAVGLWEPVN